MSSALERVIAEQQETIDQLEAIVKSNREYLHAEFQNKDKIYAEVMRLITFHFSPDIAKQFPDDMKRWRALARSIKAMLLDEGMCIYCWEFGCGGECQQD